MTYVKQGPWADYDQITPAQLTAMDIGVDNSAQSAYVNKGKVSGAITLDAQEADVFGMILTGNTTISVTNMSATGKVSRIRLALNTNMHTVTWADPITWAAPPPPLTGNPDMITLQRPVSTGPLIGRHDGTFGMNEGALPAIGAPMLDGYFAGIMDTTQPGSIPVNDFYQTGERYALIRVGAYVASLFSGFYLYQELWKPPESLTSWNGLGASLAFQEFDRLYDSGYGTRPNQNSVPAQTIVAFGPSPYGTSIAYVPSFREMLLMYRNLKPTAHVNTSPQAPHAWFTGWNDDPTYNPASDPTGAAFTTGDPGMVPVTAFQANLNYNVPTRALGALYQSGSDALVAPGCFTSTAWSTGTSISDPGTLTGLGLSDGVVTLRFTDLTGASPTPALGQRTATFTVRRLSLPI